MLAAAVAALAGGARPWLTIWMLMIMAGVFFLAAGYVVMRAAANPARAVLLWAANPLLIVELVMAGHVDALLSFIAIMAIVASRRAASLRLDVLVGILVGIAGCIQVNAIFAALGIAIPLIHDRLWGRLPPVAVVAAVTTFGLYVFTWGLSALKVTFSGAKLVISPSVWRLVQVIVQASFGSHAETTVTSVFTYVWPPLLLALAWYLYNRLSPDVPTVLAATCALTFAWMVVAPWSFPWYASIAWVTLALLPRNTLTRWLTIATGGLALLHFNGGFSPGMKSAPMP